MSTYPKVELDSFPAELIHRILNYLDTQTIFLSLYKVCKRLELIIENYHRNRLDFGLISKSNFTIISRLIHPQNIISLTLSDGFKTPGQMQYFFQIFNLNQFTQLRSLNLLQINRGDINEIFQSKTIFLLHSFKLQFQETFTSQYKIPVTFASLLKQSNLTKLDFNFWFGPMRSVIWPNECTLEYLKIHGCSLEGYITILQQTPRLRTFILDDLVVLDTTHGLYQPKVFKTFQQLKSLTFENCHRYMHQLEHLLSFTPSLTHLKIISDTNLLDGNQWERYIQRSLPLLTKFEFFFVYYSHDHEMELIIPPYSTSFWIDIKQWFVTCEYIKNLKEIRLYSIPVCKANYSYHFESNKIVLSTSMMMMENDSIVMNQVSTMHLNWTKMMDNATEELTDFPDHQLFCKLKDLKLDINHHWPFNSLEILSKFIDLSYLTDLTLNIKFNNNFISHAVENITSLLEQIYNVHSLSINYFRIDDNYDISMEIFCSMIPYHIKYLQIKLLAYGNQRVIDDMKIILNRLQHLWSITFQFDPFHSIQFDDIIDWIRYEREDFMHIHYGHYLHIWLGESKGRSLYMTTNHQPYYKYLCHLL